ncbi:MAG: prepilin peptidase [Acidobacteriota bacterium]|nr:prepilin peptidase [Acidobacteriota bacterium]
MILFGSIPELEPLNQILLAVLVTIAAAFDIRFRRIPNWLNLIGLLLGLIANAYLAELQGLGRSALGVAVGFGLYFPLFLLHARGAGDVKLLAAVGAIAGPQGCFAIFLVSAVLGGFVAIVLLIFKKRLRKTLWNVGFILKDLSRFKTPFTANPELDVNNPESLRLPHGAVIALGVYLFLAISRA